MKLRYRRLVLAAMCLALALVLPFLTGQIPEIGSALSPMHIPAFLCGFLCGPVWGTIVGATAPLLRHMLFGMPPLMAAIPMTFELAVYGLVTGLLFKFLRGKFLRVYISLIAAMIAGRIVWGIVMMLISIVQVSEFTFGAFIAGAVTGSVPGIICHIVLIPLIVLALERANLIPEEK
ncbi:MAG: ECF transporter S component [Clostridia bacterium]|nr:ECF transporter S component [Clostridia bacterium]